MIMVENYFCDLLSEGKDPDELYEEVQYTSSFIPRLYLMIIVASCCIRMKKIPAKKLIYDTLEMSKGIQHPMRGLFLRNFFIRELKDKFPYPGCRYETENGGDVNDSVDCIIRNFIEMNRLWIRMQTGNARDKEKREANRKDLCMLVGSNFSCLSQLDGIDAEFYKSRILPALLNEIISCNDVLAQQCLVESLIQVFPDDFHYAALDETLQGLMHLSPQVDIRSLVKQLIEQIGDLGSKSEVSLQEKLLRFFETSNDAQSSLSLLFSIIEETLPLFLNHSESLAQLKRIMDLCLKLLKNVTTVQETTLLVSLLTTPIESLGVEFIYDASFAALVGECTDEEQCVVACAVGEYLLAHNITVSTKENAALLITLFSKIFSQTDPNCFSVLARVLHLVRLETDEQQMEYFSQWASVLADHPDCPSCGLPLLTLIYLYLEFLKTTEQPESIYASIDKTLSYLRKTHDRQAMVATMDLALIADARNESSFAEQFLKEGIQAMTEVGSNSRLACHTVLVKSLLCVKSLSAEQLKEFSRELEENDAKLNKDVELCNEVLVQCALMHIVKTQSGTLFDEKRAGELIELCGNTIDDSSLSSREKNAARAALLRNLIIVNAVNDAVMPRDKLKDAYGNLSKAEKVNHATKKLLGELKLLIQE